MAAATPEKVGVLTSVFKAPPPKVENYEWNIQIPATFLHEGALPGTVDFGKLPFKTGTLFKAGVCTVSGILSRPECMLGIIFDMPAATGNMTFQMMPFTLDFIKNEKILTSVEHKFPHPEESERDNLFGSSSTPDDLQGSAALDKRLQKFLKSTAVYEEDEIGGSTVAKHGSNNDNRKSSNYLFEDTIDLSAHLTAAAAVDKIRVNFFIAIHEAPTAQVQNALSRVPKKPTMEPFFNSEAFSDVVICCEDEVFSAHRLVLSAASPVFHKMLQGDMKENKEGIVTIEDMDKKTVAILLRWMYSGEMDVLDFQNLVALYKAADRYDVVSLKAWCVSQIADKQNMVLENAIEIFALGELHNEAVLLDGAKQIIKANKDQIFQDKEVLKEFVASYPEFMQELLLQPAKASAANGIDWAFPPRLPLPTLPIRSVSRIENGPIPRLCNTYYWYDDDDF